MKTFAANSLAALSVLAMSLPVQAFADTETTKTAPSVTDVALSATGELHGQVVQSSGRPVSNAAVQVLHKGTVIAEVKTDGTGRYAVKGLRSGLHVVKTSQGRHVCRFWTGQTAPAAAKKSL
ncbi:MAG TPA: carboxypeptidase regulatory-like domain-containing protein, partial [Fuerstia sp.]|nr:carboxypeptidase regulatory-like domain-containing protein [Fuerstiella sp.]